MKFNNRENRCINFAGETLWISRSVTVLPVLIFVRGEPSLANAHVPLGKRGTALPDEVGKWGLPGGYLDYDETAGGAVLREIWEELGLNVPALQEAHGFIGQLDQPYFVWSEPRRRQNVTLRFPLMFLLPAEAALPELAPQVGTGEVAEARWFGLAEALELELAFDHQVTIQDCLAGYFAEKGVRLA
jgi:8-oxo-dGTP diphosphatase